jgi:hypothetical protein
MPVLDMCVFFEVWICIIVEFDVRSYEKCTQLQPYVNLKHTKLSSSLNTAN